MPVNPADSPILGTLYGSDAMRAVFDERAYFQRMLDVEAALARVQARLGIIPADAGDATARVDDKTAAAHAAMLKGHWANSRGSQSSFIALLGLVGQTKAGVNAKGELAVPFDGLNGKPRHWVETAPFVWRDQGSHERLAAKVVDGKIVRFSIDGISPFMVFDRVE